MHISKINYRVLLLSLVPLLLISPLITLNLTPSKSLSAEPPSGYTLTININPADAGIVTLNPSQPEGGYTPGTVVILQADPALSPYQFDHWSGDISSANYEVPLTMNSDKEINAHFISTALMGVLDQIQYDVNNQRGLSPLEEINHWFITEEELGQMVNDDLKEDIDDISMSQEILVLLDLLEEDEDLYTILADLYSGAVLGMYDDELDKLYIIGDVENFDLTKESTYAHEYSHALQDQNFDLGSLGLDNEDNSDISQAVRSLIEGDAKLLEVIYYWNVFDDAERETYIQLVTQSSSEVYDDVPEFIVEDLLFPYQAGLDFIFAIWQDGGRWDAIDSAYSNLPQSTEQIIHPDKYLVKDEPQEVILPDLEAALGGTWSQLDTDVFGELYMRLYLEAFLESDQAAAAAEGWDGDRYAYLKNADDDKVLVMRSIWDSTADASEFFNAYIAFMQEKTGSSWIFNFESSTAKWWLSDGASVFASQNNQNILLILASNETITSQVLAEFAEFYTPEEEENAEVGGCSCSCSTGSGISAIELLAGWGMLGICWGGGYYLLRRSGQCRR